MHRILLMSYVTPWPRPQNRTPPTGSRSQQQAKDPQKSWLCGPEVPLALYFLPTPSACRQTAFSPFASGSFCLGGNRPCPSVVTKSFLGSRSSPSFCGPLTVPPPHHPVVSIALSLSTSVPGQPQTQKQDHLCGPLGLPVQAHRASSGSRAVLALLGPITSSLEPPKPPPCVLP